uniref:Uncharacterized protein n=1 Tax=Sphaerodactylus townsendi TaxID=933632 RepID=A0ACB8EVN5_9SAUR
MPPGRVVNLMMHWVTKLAAVAPLENAGRRPLGEKKELGKDEDGEMLNCEVYHPGYFILSSLESWSQEHVESLIDDRQFGECLEQFSSVAKMGKMDLEDNTALHLIHRSIPFDFEEESERSSDDNLGLKDVTVFQKSLGGLGIGRYSEEKGGDSCNPHEEFEGLGNDLEVDSKQRLERPSSSQEHGERVEPDGDFVAFEEQDMERTSDVSKEAENLLQFGNAKKNMGTPAASCGFKSSLVLSLFYSPSEDDDDDDDSEDWSSEDEIEETGQSCLDGTLLECDTAAEGHSQHQGFPENLSGSCFSNVDPPSLLCFSKSVQPVAVASPEPKNHKEIAVSFHIHCVEDSRLEEFCDLPKPSEDQRSATGHPPHSSCQLGTERNCDLVTTETSSLDSRKEHLKR